MVRSSPLTVSRTFTVHRPSSRRSTSVTRWSTCTCTPRSSAASNSSRVSDPKSTSVPAADRVAATTWSAGRPAIISGSHSAMTPGSSVYSRPSNTGCADIARWRARMYARPASPVTKLTCGTGVMNSFGEPVSPERTRCDQNCRETWNCSLIVTALVASTEPSPPAGV